ncbi:MAG: sialate O-acetylesterase [Verrucomicrobia bacterium]|nr:sialate O-acetylesterase [Verrucomicrobiota bacterium]
MNSPCLRLVLFFSAVLAARAEISLPAIFSDHMVLQRDKRIPVWGRAAPGEHVAVTVAGQTQSTIAGADGRWRVTLAALAAGTPQTLTVTGDNTITIRDVLIGEVWLGSGQSNMAFTVNRAQDYDTERAAANFPLIRHFKEESTYANSPQSAGKGRWEICSPDTVGSFSAALYFFGRELHRALGVPVGLVNSSVGGTPIEQWIAPEAQRAAPELAPFLQQIESEATALTSDAALKKYDRDLAAWEAAQKKARTEKKKAAKKPQDPTDAAVRRRSLGALFNGKIAPLAPFALRGILWYQGEANSTPAKAPFYARQLSLLVRDWRTRWGEELPFAWVQLPNFVGAGRDWPAVREAMLKTLALPQTGMAVTIDIGEANDIHPRNKQAVGHRLALWALGTVYGRKVPAISGPLPAGHEVRGREIVLRFRSTDGGLVPHGSEVTGFVVAGADRKFAPARARIAGDTVIVSAPDVPAPVAVRYAWENLPSCNLFNGAGLPASPFRTDDWP